MAIFNKCHGIIWIKLCEGMVHMENVYKGLRHTEFTMMFIFGGVLCISTSLVHS